jgi:hypothetical protein
MRQKWMESVDWVAPQIGELQPEKLSFYTSPYLFCSCKPLQPNGLTNLLARSSNEAVYCKEVPFGSRIDTTLRFGVKTHKNSKFFDQDAKFPAKSIHSNNFWTVRVENFQLIAYTKSGSENRTVTPFQL